MQRKTGFVHLEKQAPKALISVRSQPLKDFLMARSELTLQHNGIEALLWPDILCVGMGELPLRRLYLRAGDFHSAGERGW
jgi:hypothetical protein